MSQESLAARENYSFGGLAMGGSVGNNCERDAFCATSRPFFGHGQAKILGGNRVAQKRPWVQNDGDPTRVGSKMKRCCTWKLLFAIAALMSIGAAIASEPPAPVMPLPSQNQLDWQNMELTAFAHFGINTFYDQEWGNGTEDPDRFYPTNFDPAQWAAILKEAGFKELILTCKHHDGFCLWPSAYTAHCVKSSRWYKEREAKKNGSGDVVKAVADACHHVGLKFGVYLSPWDRNNAAYGKGGAYNTYYENQLRELLSNYGEVYEVWWDGAKGDNTAQDYDFGAWADIVHQLQPHAVIFQGDYNSADIRWVGNEDGHAAEACWSAVDKGNEPDQVLPTPSGTKWMPAETDVSIRPGWFYHQSEDSAVKNINQLIGIYRDSVGRNSQLLLNIPPNKEGLISDYDKTRLMEFKRSFDAVFGDNRVRGAAVTASSSRGPGFEAERALGFDSGKYWAAPDGVTAASLTVDLGATKHFNMIGLEEPIQLGLRVTGYTLQTWDGKSWNTVAHQKCIGHEAIVSFPSVDASKIRLDITSARACPAISSIKIYNNPRVPQGDLALGKPADSDSEEDGHAAAYGNDGDDGSRWCAKDGKGGHWWQVDLGQNYTLTDSQVVWEMGRAGTIYQYKIEVSTNKTTWTVVADKSENTSINQAQSDNFSAVGRYVRVTVLGISNGQWASFYEFIVHGSPVTS